jgi:hypothetical protein
MSNAPSSMSGCNLEANLSGVDLSEAKGLTQEQLARARGGPAIMTLPQGFDQLTQWTWIKAKNKSTNQNNQF